MTLLHNYLSVHELTVWKFLNMSNAVLVVLLGAQNCFQEEYVIIDCLLRMLQMQLQETANFIFNATGSYFCLETPMSYGRKN